MTDRFKIFVLILTNLILLPQLALAYIGPGVGAGAIGAVLGVIGSIFLAIVAVLYYPLKRLIKGSKSKSKPAANKARAATGASGKPAK